MKINRIIAIFAVIFALSIAAPTSAQITREPRGSSSTTVEEERMWGYADLRSGDVLVVLSTPNDPQLDPDLIMVVMGSMLENESESSIEIRVDREYRNKCAAWEARMDGDTVFQVVCAGESRIVLALGSDEDDALNAAYSTLDDGEPTVPRSYTLIEED